MAFGVFCYIVVAVCKLHFQVIVSFGGIVPCFFRFAITSQSKYFTPTKFQNQFTINSNYYALKALVKILKQPSIKPALNCIFCRKIIKLSGFFANLENALTNCNYCIIHRKPTLCP
jgi:hypothetical protein